ncbi:type III secretion system export apparatus subunit SctV [Cupriavidus pampae]|uniref:Secretion system apparatus protein SsaV n=1 Tax=Cupriavidus pampae TaxID=659251 RepID=A0ABM8XZM9_9BURK|nr:type III secretion system export apparatus subunit SctV [Cupriavidus pampae]CAG9185920.1 Secretion system apparatus protein SsaV [Cupriavidus pampae]
MKTIGTWLGIASKRQDVVLAMLLLVAVLMLILPLPTILVDVLIAINLGMSLLLLMTAIYVREPLDLSALPSFLLITTLFRLALSVSTSRLILLQHDAGEIVTAFGNFVVGGNLAVGIIVFSIITIVQFIVITKGAERVAEVGARFSLDAMPGKQMSIDGDLRAGTIDAAEAKRQRKLVQKESQLYGAMDGAMKFVKGDAIASIIIILVNIVGGIAVGTMQQGMAAGAALNLYAVLSIGDGLISQIPGLLISIAAGIVVTRVPGEKKENLAHDLISQFSRQPSALILAGAVLMLFAVMPGFPAFVFLPFGTLVVMLGVVARRRVAQYDGEPQHADAASPNDEDAEMRFGVEPLSLRVAPDVGTGKPLTEAMAALRRDIFDRLGIALSQIDVRADASLPLGTVRVLLYNEEVLKFQVRTEKQLIGKQVPRLSFIHDIDEVPFGGLILHWVDTDHLDTVRQGGLPLLSGVATIAYPVTLAVERYADKFIGVQETRFLMDTIEPRYPELVKEVQRQMAIGKISEVLQRLVAEGISIRDLRTVFEALIEWAPKEKDSVMLAEYVRVALCRQILSRHTPASGRPNVWLIGEGIEKAVRESIRQTAAGSYSTLAADRIDLIVSQIKANLAMREDQDVALVTAIDVRRFLRKFLDRELSRVPVLSFQELGDEAQLHVLGNIDLLEEFDDVLH